MPPQITSVQMVENQTPAPKSAPARAVTAAVSERAKSPWPGFTVVSLGQLGLFINITQTTSTLASVQAALHTTSSQLVWIASIYAMTVACFVLAAGTLGDILGRRRVFTGGVLLLGLGSLLVFLAPSAAVVMAGQAVMGLGGAAILPTSLAIVTSTFKDPRSRTTAVGIWVAVSGLGLALGPILVGAVLLYFSWHAAFLVNVVLAALILVLTPRYVTESRQPGRHLDPPGLALTVVVIALLNFAVIQGGYEGFDTPEVLWSFAGFVLVLGVFLIVESRTRTPMLNLRLFRNPSFTAANLVALVAQYAFVAMAIAQVLYFQRVRHESILETGLIMLPVTGSYLLVSAVAGRVVGRLGFKVTLVLGSLTAATGTLLMLTQTAHTSAALIGVYLAVFGAGAGLVLPPSTAAAVVSVPPAEAGMASGTVNLFRQIGNTLGASVTGTIVTSGLINRLPDQLTRHGVPSEATRDIIDGIASGTPLDAVSAEVRDNVSAAFGDAFTAALHLAVLIPAVGALLAALAAVLFVRKRAQLL
ncbi:MFS transporter [Streptomyces sp. NPDC048295]|uniref:MFS transporter n=1 Tax=Streptomyces sp. NPDC048295 TaxID=3154617 RepID=UPI0034134344